MIEEGDTPIIHCLAFEIFQTTIGISNGTKHLETKVIGIKCKSSKAALLRELLLRATPNLETNGLGKFIPAGLANVIGSDTMKTLIQNNNQYLASVATIPINGLPPKALTIQISLEEEEDESDAEKMTVKDYLMSAECTSYF